MIADRYACAADLAPAALLRIWRSFPVEMQDAIGVKFLASALGELVASDDGLISTEAERDAACTLHHDAFQELYHLVEAALPQVLHYYPDGFAYEARDQDGNLVGTVETVRGGSECMSHNTHRFRPASSRRRLGPSVEGEIRTCLPKWVLAIVEAGGWFGAMLPDGRKYPDEFRSIDNDCGAAGLGNLPRVVAQPDRAVRSVSTQAPQESDDERSAA